MKCLEKEGQHVGPLSYSHYRDKAHTAHNHLQVSFNMVLRRRIANMKRTTHIKFAMWYLIP